METMTAVLSKFGGRNKNQDYCGHLESKTGSIWIVADGMGGHLGGEMASYLAVNTILEQFTKNHSVEEENIIQLLNLANQVVLQKQQEMIDYHSMQSTICLAASNDDKTIFANVGDARGYYFSNGEISYQTRDHSLPQLLVNQGEIYEWEIRHHEDRNKVLKSIGKENSLSPSLYQIQRPEKGDALLLCSDGFWELIYEQEMEVDLAKSTTPEQWLRKMELRLLKRMPQRHDNYSAIAVLFQ